MVLLWGTVTDLQSTEWGLRRTEALSTQFCLIPCNSHPRPHVDETDRAVGLQVLGTHRADWGIGVGAELFGRSQTVGGHFREAGFN